MQTEKLPYSLSELCFSFPALASLAGRLPLGGGREVALASLLIARLASALRAQGVIAVEDRKTRAGAARVWLASVALPSNTRIPFARAIDATGGTALQTAGAIRSLMAAAGGHLDDGAVGELDKLAHDLAGAT